MQALRTTTKLFLMILIFTTIFTLSNILYLAWADTISIVSTRGHFDKTTGNKISTQPYKPLDDKILSNICKEKEVVIYVHGVWTNEKGYSKDFIENTDEIFERLAMSLKDARYNYPLIGFSWDSDTQIDPYGKGWNIAKFIAKENGPKLAKFLFDLKNYCIKQNDNNIKLRLIGHSLGTRVILSALDTLDNDNKWKLSNFKISTVNILGGAVDNYEVLKNTNGIPIKDNIKGYYGNAIQNQVTNFYNMYNREDDVLEEKIVSEWDEPRYYPRYEGGGDIAIGENPLNKDTPGMPLNYKNVDVQDQVIYERDADKDGDDCDLPNFNYLWLDVCTIYGVGDNHLGYIGFRNTDKSLLDNGAIDKVVHTWRIQ